MRYIQILLILMAMMVSWPAPAGISGDMNGLTVIGVEPVKIASPQPGTHAGEGITAVHLTNSLTVYSDNVSGKNAKDPANISTSSSVVSYPEVNFNSETLSFIKSLFGE